LKIFISIGWIFLSRKLNNLWREDGEFVGKVKNVAAGGFSYLLATEKSHTSCDNADKDNRSAIWSVLRGDSKTILQETLMMKNLWLLAMFAMTAFLAVGSAGAADLNKAKGTVDNIRAAEPPQVSTSTKPSPVGQPVSEYKPTGPSVHAKEPPAPPRNYNPQNDPAVKQGYEQHQKAHGR
jgi:hypothetical protein